jgi:hypothetical protein
MSPEGQEEAYVFGRGALAHRGKVRFEIGYTENGLGRRTLSTRASTSGIGDIDVVREFDSGRTEGAVAILRDLHISKNQVHRWRQLADVPET